MRSRQTRPWVISAIGGVVITALLGPGAVALPTQPAAAPAPLTARPTQPVPDTEALAGPLADQTLEWAKCDFSLANISSEETRELLENDPDTLCTTVTVPQDWFDPDPDLTFDIAVSRTKTRATGAAHEGAILVNPGGPGGSGLPWGPALKMRSPELWQSYDLIGFDPRGVALSQNGLSCPAAATESFATACADVPAVRFINTEQATYDLDFIRTLLGYESVSYLGYSYGTWLGAWYGKTFGPTIDRMLLDSALDVTQPSIEHGWDGPQQRAKQQRVEDQIFPWMARNSEALNAEFGLQIPDTAEEVKMALLRGVIGRGGTPGDDAARNRYTADFVAATAITGCEVSLGSNQTDFVRWAVVCFGDFITAGVGSEADIAAEASYVPDDLDLAIRELGISFLLIPMINTFSSDPRIEAVDAFSPTSSPVRTAADLTEAPEEDPGGRYSSFQAVRCSDGQWTQDAAYYDQLFKDLISTNGAWGAVVRDKSCVGWETDSAMPAASTIPGRKNPFPETLVVQGELDSRTAYELGVVSAVELPDTTGVFVDNESDHALFPYGDTCLDGTVLDFFLEGRRPQQNIVCLSVPLPLESDSAEVLGVIQKDGTKRSAGDDAEVFGVDRLTPKQERGQEAIDELRSGLDLPGTMASLDSEVLEARLEVELGTD